MWWTGRGYQVLRGAEWDLFCEGLGFLFGMIEETFDDPDDDLTGIAAFDRLQPPQQLAMLALVGQAIRDEQTPAPDLTAVSEGTVAAVYRFIRGHVESEIVLGREEGNVEDWQDWRAAVLAAYRQIDAEGEDAMRQVPACTVPPSEIGYDDQDEEQIDEEWGPPSPTSPDLEEWEHIIDILSDRLLWDADYEAGEIFLVVAPRAAARYRRLSGISKDYYTAIAPDPSDAELAGIRSTLRRICGLPEPVEVERDRSVEGIEDSYHALLVGPCDAATIAEELDCPLVGEISMAVSPDSPEERDGFDCSCAEWYELFREEVRRVSRLDPAELIPSIPPVTDEQLAEAGEAEKSGCPMTLDGGYRIVPKGGRWFIADEDGLLLAGADGNIWVDDEQGAEGDAHDSDAAGNEDDFSAKWFESPGQALAFHMRSRAIFEATMARQRAAFEVLDRYRS